MPDDCCKSPPGQRRACTGESAYAAHLEDWLEFHWRRSGARRAALRVPTGVLPAQVRGRGAEVGCWGIRPPEVSPINNVVSTAASGPSAMMQGGGRQKRDKTTRPPRNLPRPVGRRRDIVGKRGESRVLSTSAKRRVGPCEKEPGSDHLLPSVLHPPAAAAAAVGPQGPQAPSHDFKARCSDGRWSRGSRERTRPWRA